MHMDKDKKEKDNPMKGKDKQQKEKEFQWQQKERFNSVTNSVKPENQNQEHNVRREGFIRRDYD